VITIRVKPAKQRFSKRKQWKFQIIAANGEPLDPRETYANIEDIRTALTKLSNSTEPIQLEIHYQDGIVLEKIR